MCSYSTALFEYSGKVFRRSVSDMVKMCFSEIARKRIMGALFMCATSVELSDEVQRELMVLFDSLHGTPGACRAKMESFKEREGE